MWGGYLLEGSTAGTENIWPLYYHVHSKQWGPWTTIAEQNRTQDLKNADRTKNKSNGTTRRNRTRQRSVGLITSTVRIIICQNLYSLWIMKCWTAFVMLGSKSWLWTVLLRPTFTSILLTALGSSYCHHIVSVTTRQSKIQKRCHLYMTNKSWWNDSFVTYQLVCTLRAKPHLMSTVNLKLVGFFCVLILCSLTLTCQKARQGPDTDQTSQTTLRAVSSGRPKLRWVAKACSSGMPSAGKYSFSIKRTPVS